MISRWSPRCSALRTVPTSVTITVNMGPRLSRPLALVNFEPVGTEPLLVHEAPAAVGIGDGVEADIAEARLALADDDRGTVVEHAVDQILGEDHRRARRSALHKQIVDVMKPIDIPRISQGFPSSARLAAGEQRATRRAFLQ